MVKLLVLLALAACTVDTSTVRQSLDMNTPWTAHTIHTGPLGSDGVHLADADGDGDLDVTSGWEESDIVTVSLSPADPTQPWPTVQVGINNNVEDAVFADVDGDGRIDVVSCGENQQVKVHFAPPVESILVPSAWVTVNILAAQNVQRWIRVGTADLDGDGQLEIIAGGRVANPATIGWLSSPTPRINSSWTWHPIQPAGLVMDIVTVDMDHDADTDILYVDRTYYFNPNGTKNWDRVGSNWLENLGGASFATHYIGRQVDPATGLTKGEPQFLRYVNGAILDGSTTYAGWNGTSLRFTPDRETWSYFQIPQPANVGAWQDVEPGDIDGDGQLDLAMSYSEAPGALSGLVWLKGPTWTRGEISGAAGSKYDNIRLHDVDGDGDLDLIASEQHEQLGLVWHENGTVP